MKLSKTISILLVVTILSLVAWFAITAKRTPDKEPQNVLFITVDTLRSDHLGCYGYKKVKTPNIDRLAEQGTMFKNAVSQVPLTLPSHASLFTSTYPQFNNVRDNGIHRLHQSAITLAERMQESGYATAAFVSAYVLDSKFGLDQGFETYDDETQDQIGEEMIGHMDAERTADKVTAAALRWLRDNKDEKRFLWVHYFDPHSIYNPPSPYRETYKDNPYDGEIAYTDEHIGMLLSALKELDLDQTTLIIFAADHGEGLGEHEESTHAVFVYDTTVKVPLIFSCPSLVPEGKVVEDQVRLIDIMPTILDFLHLEKNKEIQGESLIGLIKGEIKSLNLPAYSESLYAKLHYNWSPLKSFRTGKWKYIKSPAPELYRIRDDPQELVNLAGSRMDVVKELDGRLAEFLAATTASTVKETTMAMDEETKRKMMSLGYIGSSGASESEEPVPRKRIQILEKLKLSTRLANEGVIDKAIEGFNEVLKSDPKNIQANAHLAQCYSRLGKYDQAIQHFKTAATFNPHDAEIINRIGACYLEKLEFDKALEHLTIAIELDPQYAEAYSNRGAAHAKSGNNQRAIANFDKAIELDAEFAEAYANRGLALAKSGDHQMAIGDFDKAIELDPENAAAYYKRGIAYQQSGNDHQAIKDYDRVIELAPKYAPAYYNRGMAYEKSDNSEQAIKDYAGAIELAPKYAPAYSARGLAYEKSGNYQRAIADYKKFIELNPQSAPAYAHLAKVSEKKENVKEAIDAWKSVLAIDPQHLEARKNLTRLNALIRK